MRRLNEQIFLFDGKFRPCIKTSDVRGSYMCLLRVLNQNIPPKQVFFC